MPDMTPRAAPAPALAPFPHARSAPGRRRRVERVLVLCRLRGRGAAPMPGARRKRSPAGSMIAPSARSPAFRSASKCAARAPACRWSRRPRGRDAGAVHGAARRNPGGGADLRSETADRGIQGAGDDRRSRRAAVADGELEQGPQQRGRPARGAAARLDRVRRALDRPHQRFGADAAGARQARRAARPSRRRIGRRPTRDRDRAARSSRQRAGAASGAGRAIRCRRPHAC